MVNGRDLAVNTALLMANKTGESIFFLPIGNFDLTRHQHPTIMLFVTHYHIENVLRIHK